MLNPKNICLLIGAVANFAIALVHFVIIWMGPFGYLYFGAADLAELATQGSPLPGIITFGLAILFCVFGLYALSGAGLLPRLPLLTPGLITMGSIYTLRGLIIIFDLLRLIRGAGYPFRQIVFSGTALVTGLIILIGVALQLKRIPATRN